MNLRTVDYDPTSWSGEGAFTQALLDVLRADPAVAALRVEDAPASREDASFSFISNEIHIGFAAPAAPGAAMSALSLALEEVPSIGAPDYADDTMIQYLRTERVIPPYQTRGIKLIEMVRLYEMRRR